MQNYDGAGWKVNNYNVHITQYVKKYREPCKGIWSVIRIYHERYFLLKNHTQKVVKKLVPDPFTKNKNWSCLWISNLKCYKAYFSCMCKSRSTKIIKVLITCFYLMASYEPFSKTKKRSETSFSISFSAWFLKKNIYVMFIIWLNFIAFTSWDIGQKVYCKCLLSSLWRQKFWN